MGNLGSLYLSFSGRISRQPWWLGLLAMVVIEWILMFIVGMLLGSSLASVDPADQAAVAGAMTKTLIPTIIV